VSDHFTAARQGFPSAVPLWILACSLLRSGFPPFARSLCWWPKSAAKPGLDPPRCENFARRGLTFPACRGKLVFRCPFRSFGGRPSRGVRGRQKPLGRDSTRRLFLCAGAPPAPPEVYPSQLRPPPSCHLILCHYSGERNKTSVILLRWRPPQKVVGSYTANPPRPLRASPVPVNKIMVLCRSPLRSPPPLDTILPEAGAVVKPFFVRADFSAAAL
jgi:hypothetical protein